jgi:hypothetical protein
LTEPNCGGWKDVHAADVAARVRRRALRRHRRAGGRRGAAVLRDQAGATGDITLAPETSSNAFVLWSHPRASGYTPSALVHQGRVYLVHDTGIMVVVAADTGKEIYKARVGGVGHTFAASPDRHCRPDLFS